MLNEINIRIIEIETKIIAPWRGFEHAVFFWYPEISGLGKSKNSQTMLDSNRIKFMLRNEL